MSNYYVIARMKCWKWIILHSSTMNPQHYNVKFHSSSLDEWSLHLLEYLHQSALSMVATQY
jgi:hypothetical protein